MWNKIKQLFGVINYDKTNYETSSIRINQTTFTKERFNIDRFRDGQGEDIQNSYSFEDKH